MAEVRSRNPRGQGERLREDLLVAAVGLLAEHRSSNAVTLRQVAARVGVSPTAVYRHFANRDDLIRAAVTWCWDRFDAALEVPDTGDPGADFLAQGVAYVHFAGAEPGIYRVLFSHREPLGGHGPHPGARVFAKLVHRVGGLLHLAGDPRDPVVVAAQVHTWIHGIADLQGGGQTHGTSVEWLVGEVGVRLGLVPQSPG
jgi:AcrR family transcriptional regulator